MKKLSLSTLALALVLFGLALGGCKFGSSSPTATFKAYFDAQKKKDVAGVKKTLSKSTLAVMEKSAKEQNKTVDQSITEQFAKPGAKAEEMPATRNEKIDGDNATLEVEDKEAKKWDKVYFVKEDNEWKLALDKTIEELFKNLGNS